MDENMNLAGTQAQAQEMPSAELYESPFAPIEEEKKPVEHMPQDYGTELADIKTKTDLSPEEQKMRFAIMDTMGDAVLNVLGAVPMYLILRRHPYRHSGKRDVNRQIEEMLAAEAEQETVSV